MKDPNKQKTQAQYLHFHDVYTSGRFYRWSYYVQRRRRHKMLRRIYDEVLYGNCMNLVHFELEKVKNFLSLIFLFSVLIILLTQYLSNSVNNTSPVSSQHGLKHYVWQKL